MSTCRYEFHVNGLATGEGRIAASALRELLEDVTECAGKALRLAVEGTSVKAGRPPTWLDSAVDFTVTGIGPGCTMVSVEAPVLSELLGEDLNQAHFFADAPSGEDTALSLFSRSVRATMVGDMESNSYDRGVLKSLLGFRRLFRGVASSIELRSPDRAADEVTFGLAEIEKVERLRHRIPEPQAFVVSGKLDSIHHSEKRFWLELPDGQKVPGRVDEEFLSAEDLRDLWGGKVTIKGLVHFRPSGKVQLLEAQTLTAAGTGDEVFAVSPRIEESPLLFDTARIDSSTIGQLRGKWPGDESIDELLDALRDD
ncbi:MAG: hypothetical protein SFU53_04160 [Terrimicrobiaceae bacterium]|nr:hypothetical protein [Terrimicrobiaceae bacterium]